MVALLSAGVLLGVASGAVFGQMRYKEAPMLAEMVKAGKLPSVEKRLPKEPLVIKPFERVGKYGGTLRFGNVETNLWNYATLRTNGLFRYNQTNDEVLVDIAKSYGFSSDLKTLIIELREGHKWSDGEPFTADDIIFWWEDVATNKDLTPVLNPFWAPGGKPAVFKKISPTRVEIAFAVPYPTAIDLLGRSWFSADPPFMMPKHYITKWHIKYNPKANDVAKEEGFDSWTKAFMAHATSPNNFDVKRPTLWAWIPEKITADRAIAVRNPYFHQVDAEGNQLPYIDRIDTVITGNKEVQILKATSGEFDIEIFYTSLRDMPVFKQNEKQGNYHIILPQSLRPSMFALMPNRTVKDPVLRELFNNLDFRIALSISINREAMNKAIFFGLGKPFPALPLPTMSFFKPEWATSYMQYDPDRANKILDSLGLTKRDSEGYRLRPDGKGRISMLVEIGVREGPKEEMAEMVKSDWAKVGLEAIVKSVEGGLYSQRTLANDLQIGNWHLDRAGLFGRANPLWFGVVEPSQNRWGTQWALWFQSGGKEGIEPPQEIKNLRATYDKWVQTLPGTPEFNRLGAEYYDYFATQLPMIGTVGLEPVPMVVSNRLRNVPDKDIWWGSDTNFYAPYLPAQWYIAE
jgi:peptide/nickel transport system substrate-binding protein